MRVLTTMSQQSGLKLAMNPLGKQQLPPTLPVILQMQQSLPENPAQLRPGMQQPLQKPSVPKGAVPPRSLRRARAATACTPPLHLSQQLRCPSCMQTKSVTKFYTDVKCADHGCVFCCYSCIRFYKTARCPYCSREYSAIEKATFPYLIESLGEDL